MIFIRDYEETLKRLGTEYFIHNLQSVPNLMSWVRDNGKDLGEPHHPMKLVAADNSLTMIMQSEIDDESLNDVIRNLGLRWSIKDNSADINKKLDDTTKRLVYCFLKEYARTLRNVGGDELLEDQWVFDEMDDLGFFKE
ncbi:MAG: hypothetical protein C4560_02450 [Nitrospiraceae bacterium]|nr:MAG: hypothetical protein C4560_02450 [Nitrospiraceae bacterium]